MCHANDEELDKMRHVYRTIPYIIGCAAVAFVGYRAYTNLIPQENAVELPQEKVVVPITKSFEDTKLSILTGAFGDKDGALGSEVIGEIQTIYTHNNPDIDPKIKFVWVLSARHNYKKQVSSSPQNANAFDPNDGFDRMNLGVAIARKVAAKNAGKSEDTLTLSDIIAHGPRIFYNGEEESNNTLIEVLRSGIINYPSRKFVILPIPKGQVNTIGQFESLKNGALGKNIDLVNEMMAIVTHAYHWPRTGRIDVNKYFPSTTIVAHLVDRQFQAPGADKELFLEAQKLPSYIEKGFIVSQLNHNIQYNGNVR